MKNIKLSIALSIAFAILLSSCSKEEDATVDNVAEIQEVQSTMQTGNWRITNLNDSGEDETADFTDYTFTFAEDGTITATNGTTTQTGTWSVINDRDDDDTQDDIEFNILFSVSDTSDFEDLNDDWDIVSISDTKIELIDLGDANEAPERLTFERN